MSSVKLSFVLTSVLCCAVSGCTWVKVSASGAQVDVATADAVSGCTKIGEVQSHTRDRVLLKRGRAKVQQELIDLSRDQAAGLGADTIVPVTEEEAGHQTYAAYKCR